LASPITTGGGPTAEGPEGGKCIPPVRCIRGVSPNDYGKDIIKRGRREEVFSPWNPPGMSQQQWILEGRRPWCRTTANSQTWGYCPTDCSKEFEEACPITNCLVDTSSSPWREFADMPVVPKRTRGNKQWSEVRPPGVCGCPQKMTAPSAVYTTNINSMVFASQKGVAHQLHPEGGFAMLTASPPQAELFDGASQMCLLSGTLLGSWPGVREIVVANLPEKCAPRKQLHLRANLQVEVPDRSGKFQQLWDSHNSLKVQRQEGHVRLILVTSARSMPGSPKLKINLDGLLLTGLNTTGADMATLGERSTQKESAATETSTSVLDKVVAASRQLLSEMAESKDPRLNSHRRTFARKMATLESSVLHINRELEQGTTKGEGSPNTLVNPLQMLLNSGGFNTLGNDKFAKHEHSAALKSSGRIGEQQLDSAMRRHRRCSRSRRRHSSKVKELEQKVKAGKAKSAGLELKLVQSTKKVEKTKAKVKDVTKQVKQMESKADREIAKHKEATAKATANEASQKVEAKREMESTTKKYQADAEKQAATSATEVNKTKAEATKLGQQLQERTAEVSALQPQLQKMVITSSATTNALGSLRKNSQKEVQEIKGKLTTMEVNTKTQVTALKAQFQENHTTSQMEMQEIKSKLANATLTLKAMESSAAKKTSCTKKTTTSGAHTCVAQSNSAKEANSKCHVDVSQWAASVTRIAGTVENMAQLCIIEGRVTMQRDRFSAGFIVQIPDKYMVCWPTSVYEFAVSVKQNNQSGTGILRIEPHGMMRVEHIHAAGTAYSLPESHEDKQHNTIDARLEGITFVPNGPNPFPDTCVAQCYPPQQESIGGVAPPVGCIKRCELNVARMDEEGKLRGATCPCRLNKRLTCFPNECGESECGQFKELANTASLSSLCIETCQKHLIGF